MSSSYRVPIAIVVGGAIIALAIYFALADEQPTTSSGHGNPALVRPVDANDHILGNPQARVMIIEYADYDCDWCKTLHDTMTRVIADKGARGEVAWVYRQFPLTELHANAFKHAQAAECVAKTGGNDAFWKFSNLLFKNQPVNPERYGTLAAEVGVPSEAFRTCYTSAATEVDARITADRENALAAGASGAPYSLIVVAGKPPIVMDAAYPQDAIELLIEQALMK